MSFAFPIMQNYKEIGQNWIIIRLIHQCSQMNPFSCALTIHKVGDVRDGFSDQYSKL
jgi:hypothetical protein